MGDRKGRKDRAKEQRQAIVKKEKKETQKRARQPQPVLGAT